MTKAKRALGRGLEALLPVLEVREGERILELSVSDISANPYQPRCTFDEDKLKELAESIREHGVLQPVIVRPRSGGYDLVAGERRVRAAKMAGLATIPAVVRDLSDAEMMEIALIENVQRQDLNPMEEARAYRAAMERLGLTQETLAERLGKSRPAVANMLRLLHLHPEVQGWLEEGRLSMGHAKALLALANPEVQRHVGLRVIEEGLNVRETERLVRGWGKRSAERKKGSSAIARRAAADVAILEEGLRLALGARTRIKHGPRRGIIEIEYFGTGDLERIYEIITGASPGA